MKKLSQLDAHEVSLVPKGANKKRFLIFKAAQDGEKMDKKALLDLVAKVDPEAMARVEKALDEMCKTTDGQQPAMDERAQTALKAVSRILLPFKGQIKDEHVAQALDAAGFFDETSNPGSPMEGTAGVSAQEKDDSEEGEMEDAEMEDTSGVKPIHRQEAMSAAEGAYKSHLEKLGYQKYPAMQPRMKKMSLRKSSTTTPKVGDEQTDKGGHDVSKSEPVLKADGTLNLEAVPEESRPFVEVIYKGQQEAVKKAELLQKELDAERDKRETAEYVAKAKAFDKLSVEPTELGGLLKKISKALSAEEFGKVEAALKAANEQVSKGALFAELGSKKEGATGDAYSKIEAGAKSMVQKSGEKLSDAQAIEKFLTTDEGRKLQVEYEAEKGRKF